MWTPLFRGPDWMPITPKWGSFLHADSHTCADALRERKNPPALDAVEQALAKFIATIDELRREGATRALPVENIGRLYALGFAVEQLRQNFVDFRNRVTECARVDSEA